MIQEVIVTTQNAKQQPHIAPMGIHVHGDEFIILPFRPSKTLDNIIESKTAVINYSDDVRIFVGCLIGKQNWPLTATTNSQGHYLTTTLAYRELELTRIEENISRPKLYCKAIHSVNHAPFQGFNRAQFAVLEAAILVSRLSMLPMEKIESEIKYLGTALNKTAGERELEAWGWLMTKIAQYKQETS